MINILLNKETGDIIKIASRSMMFGNPKDPRMVLTLPVTNIDNVTEVPITSVEGENEIITGYTIEVDANTTMPTNLSAMPEAFASYKGELLTKIEQLPKNYIYKHYDAGVQQTLAAKFVVGNDNQKAAIASIWNWVESVMVGYYTKKQQLYNATTVAELLAVEFSLDAFDATLPGVSLREIMMME